MKQVLKYFSVVLILMILGIGAVWNISAHAEKPLHPGSTENTADNCSRLSLGTSDQIYVLVVNTFSSIRQVETVKLNKLEECAEVFKLLSFYPKRVFFSSVELLNHSRIFLSLLSERHTKGFYIYALEKLII